MPSARADRETWGSLLRSGRDRLQAGGIDDAGIEAELLMRQALRKPGAPLPSKAWLLPRLGTSLEGNVREYFEALLARRLAHEPTAYITGSREFHALTFEVSPDVLIPRPETEGLVSIAHMWASGSTGHWATYPPAPTTGLFLNNGRSITDPWTVVDVGTGSGAIAVSLAKQLAGATVIATDVSWQALAVARVNAERQGVARQITFRHGHLLEPMHDYVDFIAANLPYVPENDWRALEPEVRDYEPRLALEGGSDGLDLIRALLHQAPRYLRPGGAVCLEFGYGQVEALRDVTAKAMPEAGIETFEDYAGIPRVLLAWTGRGPR